MGDEVTDVGWWSDAVGYEVYLRSFADSDGDGIGDLAGLTGRLDHLADLGVDIVWVTPFYPSPMADFGYDVADYLDVDPRFGTLADFDRLVEAVHARGMRLIVDLVPNHTSDQHEWFRSALEGPDSPHRDFYLWRDPAPDGGPPNNWRSHFGGPAWTLDESSGQYWCHLFLPEQPDLNWANPAVHAAFQDIIGFWLDRGVDGFRIDVAHSLVKDPSFADNPVLVEVAAGASPLEAFRALRHDHDLDQPGTLDIYREWHELTAPRGAMLLGEVYLDSADLGCGGAAPRGHRDPATRPGPVLLGALEPRRPPGADPLRRRGPGPDPSPVVPRLHRLPARPAVPVPGRRARPGGRTGRAGLGRRPRGAAQRRPERRS
jgi:alpha-glucosidase